MPREHRCSTSRNKQIANECALLNEWVSVKPLLMQQGFVEERGKLNMLARKCALLLKPLKLVACWCSLKPSKQRYWRYQTFHFSIFFQCMCAKYLLTVVTLFWFNQLLLYCTKKRLVSDVWSWIWIYFILGCICECCKVTMYLPLNIIFNLKSAGLLLSLLVVVCKKLT